MSENAFPSSLSVTEAAKRGLPRIVADAENGAAVVIERRGQKVAAVMAYERARALVQREDDVRDAILVLSRIVTDSGGRTGLDDVIAAFGFDRDELERELDAEITAGFVELPDTART